MQFSNSPKAQYMAHQTEIDEAIQRVLQSGTYILGPEVNALEQEFSRFCGANFGIGVANGTDAIKLALMALEIGENDEVITVSHTALATVSAIEATGATAVLVDIEPNTYTIDTKALETALSERTRAIVPVHLYGHPAKMGEIIAFAEQHHLFVVEDCAQAHGARYLEKHVGTFGIAGCFSFYPTKNVGALGDGGMIICNDHTLSEKLKYMREYGWDPERISRYRGINSRLDEIQAAILRVKLKYLDQNLKAREAIVAIYDTAFQKTRLRTPRVMPKCKHAWHQYVLRFDDRDELIEYLGSNNIATAVHYRVPVHKHPSYRSRIRCINPLNQTEQAVSEILSLPLYPEISRHTAKDIAVTTASFSGS